MQIRDAVHDDFEQLTDLYNQVLQNSTAIYNERPATVAERLAWWEARQTQGFPVLVAVENTVVLGFASFGEFRHGSGYRFTVEGTIHVAQSMRGQGIGTALLAELLSRAHNSGKHSMIAGVDSENKGSLRFLKRAGFFETGRLYQVGFKFGRYLDLVFLQHWLTLPEPHASANEDTEPLA